MTEFGKLGFFSGFLGPPEKPGFWGPEGRKTPILAIFRPRDPKNPVFGGPGGPGDPSGGPKTANFGPFSAPDQGSRDPPRSRPSPARKPGPERPRRARAPRTGRPAGPAPPQAARSRPARRSRAPGARPGRARAPRTGRPAAPAPPQAARRRPARRSRAPGTRPGARPGAPGRPGARSRAPGARKNRPDPGNFPPQAQNSAGKNFFRGPRGRIYARSVGKLGEISRNFPDLNDEIDAHARFERAETISLAYPANEVLQTASVLVCLFSAKAVHFVFQLTR